MTDQFLPPQHVIETVRPGSRFLGALDYATHRPIAVGDTIVVCRRVSNPAVTSVEAWSEAIETCYNCNARNPGLSIPAPGSPTKKIPSGASTPTVVIPPHLLPGGGARGPRSNRLAPLFALLAAVVLLAFIGFLFTALGNGGAADAPATFRPPATESGEGVVILMAEPTRPTDTLPTAVPSTSIPPTPAPPPTERASPTAVPPPTATLQPVSPIRELVLIDAVSDRVLMTLTDGSVISLSQLGARRLAIQANIGATPVGSIKFLLDGGDFCLNGRCLENSPPYSMAGDLSGDHYDNWDWGGLLGSHTIKAIPYTATSGAGEALTPLSIQITVTQ